MTLNRMLAIAGAAALIAVAPLLALPATAQTQPQGVTVGAPPPGMKPAAPGAPLRAGGAKVTRAKCSAEGREKGLKGKALRAFVTTCLNG